VFLAQDLRHHQRAVAIKVLDPALAKVIGPERFLREIEIVARLSHPHILPFLESGAADGFLFYVMPYAEGESLKRRLDREKQLPLEDAVRITREVGDALDFAHRRGVIHRDIKPENILLQEQHAVVVDFGIAQAAGSAADGRVLTGTGVVIGSPAWMSPEQVAGSKHLDGRSDQYSLGCVLFEMLTGQPPFTGPTESIMRQHLSVAPRPVTDVRPTVPLSMSAAISRALAKAPADRFRTTAEFADGDCGGGDESRRVRANRGANGRTGTDPGIHAAATARTSRAPRWRRSGGRPGTLDGLAPRVPASK
jgi:serine/threonine-protein kinase